MPSAICIIAGAICGAYVVMTLPILGVLFIDDEMGSFSDLAMTYIMMGGISLGVSCIISLLHFLLATLSRFYKLSQWVVPLLFALVINCIAVIYVWIYYAGDIFGGVMLCGIVGYLSVLFLLYRVLERGIEYMFKILSRFID